jgi:hypothetical protein
MSSSKAFQGLTFYVPIGSNLKKTVKQLQSLVTSHGGTFASGFSDKVRFYDLLSPLFHDFITKIASPFHFYIYLHVLDLSFFIIEAMDYRFGS